jgi:hypothetical protein
LAANKNLAIFRENSPDSAESKFITPDKLGKPEGRNSAIRPQDGSRRNIYTE